MAVDPNIKKKANDIRNKIYGKEVRESLASGLEEMSSDVIENEGRQGVVESRQDSVESQWQVVSDEMTDKDVISAPEIIAARDGEANLKDRLDKEKNEVTAQLDQTNRLLSTRSLVKHGFIEFPDDFPHKLPFQLYRSNDGLIYHNFKLPKEFDNATVVYIDSDNGNDTNDGLTANTAKRVLSSTLSFINSLPDEYIILEVKNKIFSREYISNGGTVNKKLLIRPSANLERSWLGTSNSHLSWSNDNGAYKTNRTATQEVADYSKLDFFGEPTYYKKVNSVSEVRAEEGTWYTDGTSVWVNRLDGGSITSDIRVLVTSGDTTFDMGINSELYIENISFNRTSTNALTVQGDVSSEVYLKNARFSKANSNGLRHLNVGKIFVFNSIAYDVGADGFNYHGTGDELVFEYNSTAFDCGDGSNINNGSTAHDGMSIVRVGTNTYDTNGPIIADVGGCYSLLYDCVSHDSWRDGPSLSKSAYFFQSLDGKGKVYMENCQGGGEDTYSLTTDEIIPVFLRNFVGDNIPRWTNINVL